MWFCDMYMSCQVLSACRYLRICFVSVILIYPVEVSSSELGSCLLYYRCSFNYSLSVYVCVSLFLCCLPLFYLTFTFLFSLSFFPSLHSSSTSLSVTQVHSETCHNPFIRGTTCPGMAESARARERVLGIGLCWGKGDRGCVSVYVCVCVSVRASRPQSSETDNTGAGPNHWKLIPERLDAGKTSCRGP